MAVESPVPGTGNTWQDMVGKGGMRTNAVCLIGISQVDTSDAMREHVLSRMDADLFIIMSFHGGKTKI